MFKNVTNRKLFLNLVLIKFNYFSLSIFNLILRVAVNGANRACGAK